MTPPTTAIDISMLRCKRFMLYDNGPDISGGWEYEVTGMV